MGIKLATNIDIGTSLPLDSREVVETLQERDNIPNHVRYEGLIVYVKSEMKNFQLQGGISNSDWGNVGNGSDIDTELIYTKEELDNMFMDKADATHNHNLDYYTKEQIDNMDIGGEDYVHPNTHKADMIIFDDGESVQDKYVNGGIRGEKGESFKYEDFTQEQLESLKGEKGTYIGTTPPSDTELLWLNPEDEDVDATINGGVLEEFRGQLGEMNRKITDLHYAINYELDAGSFDPKDEIEYPEGQEPPNTNKINNVEKICIKRGLKQNLTSLFDGELAFCTDTGELYIGFNGKLMKITGSSGDDGDGGDDGMGNVTTEYIDLISSSGIKFRMRVTDRGDLYLYKATLDEAQDPTLAENVRFKGLIINQVYAGGTSDSATCSHDFIELYNTTANPINLKGLSLQYSYYESAWQSLELRGEVPAYSSFLVRCGANKPSIERRITLIDADMDWNLKMSDRGVKVYLTVGRSAVTNKNPYNFNGLGDKLAGYIDLIGVGGKDKTRVVEAYESVLLHIMDKSTGIRRHDFNDTDNARSDLRAIDYTQTENAIYAPRCSRDGAWDIYFDKLKLDPNKPNLISITFGQNAETTRCITWQTLVTSYGYCKYRKVGEEEWTIVPSEKRYVQHIDTDATTHNVVLENLTAGRYEYIVGEDDKWSEINNFDVKTYNNSSTIKIIHTTDQQGWDAHEYKAWKIASDYLNEVHPLDSYDFRINTGDISQNANRSFEWRYYFKHNEHTLANKVEMTTVGNNDLINKLYTDCFTYYFKYQNSPKDSVYSYDVGYAHFISLDSWVGLAHQGDEYNNAVLNWLRADLEANKDKRWIIVYMHLAPYTVSINAKQQMFVPLFEEYKVHLVMCGHNHCYTRSKPLHGKDEDGLPIVDQENGTYYIMSQATGYKLEGKDKPKPNTSWLDYSSIPDQPSYIEWTIDYDKINMKAYKINGILSNVPEEVGSDLEYRGTPERVLFDECTINHR